MQRLFTPSFPCVNAIQNICELHAKAMFIIPGLFPGYLNAKKTLIKSYLVHLSLFHFSCISISVVCEDYLFPMLGLFKRP